MTGQGECRWADGTNYKGQWIDCRKEGQGILTYSDGSIFTGRFVGDLPNGLGQKVFLDGSVYRGSFQNGKFHGQGKYKQPREDLEYEGSWFNNEIKGMGIKKVGNLEIGGVFENGTVSGKGFKKWLTSNGFFSYRGQLLNSQIHGFGVFKWPDGRHYIGDFIDSQMHGLGKLTWQEGGLKCVYKG